jgi:hypothetical protein
LSERGAEGLFAKALPDGPEKQALKDSVPHRGFAVFTDGIYYLYPRGGRAPVGRIPVPFQMHNDRHEVRFYRFATGASELLGEIDGPLVLGFAVSPDRSTFLFSKNIDAGADLMMIENLR